MHKYDPKKLDLKTLEAAMYEYFYGHKIIDDDKIIDFKNPDESMSDLLKDSDITYNALKEKILPGYSYKIYSGYKPYPGSRSVSAITGKGGVIMYIEACEKTSMPAGWCAESIFVYCGHDYISILDLITIDKSSKDEKK